MFEDERDYEEEAYWRDFCPGYCDDHQTYNLRPAETGGEA